MFSPSFFYPSDCFLAVLIPLRFQSIPSFGTINRWETAINRGGTWGTTNIPISVFVVSGRQIA